jgi:hypothetical protein
MARQRDDSSEVIQLLVGLVLPVVFVAVAATVAVGAAAAERHASSATVTIEYKSPEAGEVLITGQQSLTLSFAACETCQTYATQAAGDQDCDEESTDPKERQAVRLFPGTYTFDFGQSSSKVDLTEGADRFYCAYMYSTP